MNEMIITSAQYDTDENNNNICVNATIDGVAMSVPLAAGNRHYDEIMRQVEAGTLTIHRPYFIRNQTGTGQSYIRFDAEL